MHWYLGRLPSTESFRVAVGTFQIEALAAGPAAPARDSNHEGEQEAQGACGVLLPVPGTTALTAPVLAGWLLRAVERQ
jgi:hypothetical protein